MRYRISKVILFLSLLCICLIMSGCSNKESTTRELNDKVFELEEEISSLEYENESLEASLEYYKEELEDAKIYIEELQQLLEENGIDEDDGLEVNLTDGSAN